MKDSIFAICLLVMSPYAMAQSSGPAPGNDNQIFLQGGVDLHTGKGNVRLVDPEGKVLFTTGGTYTPLESLDFNWVNNYTGLWPRPSA